MKQQAIQIGLIGAGLMGSGIAASLLRHKHSVTILEHEGNQPLDPLIEAGAKTAKSAAELACSSDIVILCVTGSPQVEQVLFQEEGVLAGLKKGATVIDCSTAIPSSTLKIATAVKDAGGAFLDAPMTRTPKEAAEGRLNLIVGGDRDVFDHCLPVLKCYAENITHAGAVGSGHRMKLLHNYVSLGFAAVLAEAAACAHKAGTDPQTFCEILAKGGGAGVVLDRMRPFIEADDPSGFRFSISNTLKDISYYCTMAQEQNAQSHVAQAIRALYGEATSAGLDQAPLPELIHYLEAFSPPPSTL